MLVSSIKGPTAGVQKKKTVEISIFKLMVFIQVCHAGNHDGVHEIK